MFRRQCLPNRYIFFFDDPAGYSDCVADMESQKQLLHYFLVLGGIRGINLPEDGSNSPGLIGIGF